MPTTLWARHTVGKTRKSVWFDFLATRFPVLHHWGHSSPHRHSLFTLNSTSRQLDVLSVQKAGRWVWAIVPQIIRISVSLEDKIQSFFQGLKGKRKRQVPASLYLFLQLSGIPFTPLSSISMPTILQESDFVSSSLAAFPSSPN